MPFPEAMLPFLVGRLAPAALLRRLISVPLLALGAWLATGTAYAAEWQPGPDASGPSYVVGFADRVRQTGGDWVVEGWVLDRTAEGWTGITEVHVYAGEVGTGPFLGAAQVHQPRPDVAAALGNPYWQPAGFSLQVDQGRIPSSVNRLTVYARTPGRGWWALPVPIAPPVAAVAPAATPALAPTPTPPPSPVRTPVPTTPSVQVTAEQEAFIQQVGQIAHRFRAEINLPPSLVTAIAINESGWGRSKLSREANNYFGIKAHRGPGTAGTYTIETWEVVDGERITITAAFRAYYNLEESVRDLGTFLKTNSRYEPVFRARDDGEAAARALLAAGYATDPAWADKLIRLMRVYGLARLDV